MGSWVSGSYSVSTTPLTKVAEPVREVAPVVGSVSTAEQVLRASSATIGPGPMPPGAEAFGGLFRVTAELQVTEPPGPVVPVQSTLMGPEGGADGAASGHRPPKITAGPYWAEAPFGSVWLTVPPVGGRTTDGLEAASALPAGTQPVGVLGDVQTTWPNPRSIEGPPKRLTSVW
jgi:hypothetical protein